MKTRPIRSDSRWTVTREFTGDASGKPQFVIRFCGDWQGSRSTYPAAVVLAVATNAMRNGALVIY